MEVLENNQSNNMKVKGHDEISAKLGDILTYTVNIKNMEKVEAENVSVKINIPKYLEFVKGSLTVDGDILDVESLDDVIIKKLLADEIKVIKFKVEVKPIQVINEVSSDEVENNILQINNESKYEFNCFNEKEYEYISKQIRFNKNIKIPDNSAPIKRIENIDIEIEDIEYEVSNQNPKKIVITGILRESIEYYQYGMKRGKKTIKYKIPFKTYIEMNENINYNNEIQVQTNVENIYYKKINSREFFNDIIIKVKINKNHK